MKGAVAGLLAGWLLLAAPAAQQPGKDDDEVGKLAAKDPYTAADPEAMRTAGVVSYAPFPWADGHRTADVDKLLGEQRILWLETEHFRIGSTLRSIAWPDANEPRKALQEELRNLRKRLKKAPEKPKRIDPWLRAHLYARRCEETYARCLALLGVTAADFPAEKPFLGLPDKFLLLLFEKKSDMVRYMDRFCGRKDDTSLRWYHDKSQQVLLCVAVEGFDGIDEIGLHGHVLHGVWHALLSGHGGYPFEMPAWLADGVAHWHARVVPGEFLNVRVRDDEAVAEDKRNEWDVKVRRRVQHETLMIPFATMAAWASEEELGYHQTLQTWSRIDYLMRRDPTLVGKVLRELKAGLSGPTDFAAGSAAARERAAKLLLDQLGVDAPTFDRQWREWVLKTYPRQ